MSPSLPTRNPYGVQMIRALSRRWPLPKGRRRFLSLCSGYLKRHALIEMEPGVWLPPDFDDLQVLWFFAEGVASWSPIDFVTRQLIGADDTVLDVGANIGLWLMVIARRAARVIAFEPFAANFERLRRNVEVNALAHVECHRLAVSSHAGTSPFFQPVNSNSGTGSLSSQEGTADIGIDVDTVTLDQFVRDHALGRVDLIKVDVEGHELEVFEGARGLLGSPGAPIVFFEAQDRITMRAGFQPSAPKQFLEQFGYRVFANDRGRLRPVAPGDPHESEDLLALKAHHWERHPILGTLIRHGRL